MREKTAGLLIYIIWIAFATSPVFVVEEVTARNNLLIAVMCVSPIVLFTYHLASIKDLLPGMLIFFVVANPLLFHPDTIRWETILFTILFCLNFMAYTRLIKHSGLKLEKYICFIKYCIYAYALVLIIQQLCVLLGLPIFLLGNYNMQEPWKLNSLTIEPSHSVRYVALLMYSYITMKECYQQRNYDLFQELKTDKWLWFAFLWLMTTSFSVTGLLFLFIVFTKFIRRKNVLPLTVFAIFLLAVLLISNNTAIERAYNFTRAIGSLDEQAIIQADHSGSARIVPMLFCAKMIDLFTLEGWVGHGVDYVSSWMYLYFPGVSNDFTAGGILSFCVEYGFIPFLIFMYFSFSTVVRRHDFTSLLFWLFMCLNEGINMQLTWAAILFLYSNKVFLQQYNDVHNKTYRRIL